MVDPIREAIRDRALSSGFDAVGFAEARLGAEARAGLSEFIARGYHGDMGWLASGAERRGDPRALWPEARTLVVLGVNYAPEDDPTALLGHPDRGVFSVYARGRDYHDTLKRRLGTLAHWIEGRWPGALKLFVDTAPVMEKPLAAQAGIGWQGKHTNLVWNKFAHASREPDFLPRRELTAPRLVDLAGLDDAGFRRLFAGTAVKRTGRNRFVRNVLIAIGNTEPGDPDLIAAAQHNLDDPSPLVRAAAAWAFRRQAPPERYEAERARRLSLEDDPVVKEEWGGGPPP